MAASSASSLFLLALPSAAACGLLAWHRHLNLGARRTLAWFLAVFAYGALRGLAIRHVTRDALGTPFPYLMGRPVFSLLGVSLQELVGWAVAATLAQVLADRLVRSARRVPAPHRVAAGAALVMAAVSLAVENAAITAGWWTWTLGLPQRGALRVPLVALVDWGFVAFDFLLPWLLFATPANLAARLPALLIFPLHMLGHTWFAALPEPLPVAGNDLVHVGVVAYVLWRAAGERGESEWPAPGDERAPWLPALASALVVVATACACLSSGEPRRALASVPLLGLAGLAFARRGRAASRERGRPAAIGLARLALLAAAIAFLAGVSAPATRRQRLLVESVEQGVARLNAGDVGAAEALLRQAVAWRPDHAGARTLLALVLLREARTAEARAELERALGAEPTARDALILATTLDLAAGDRGRAQERAALGRRVYPELPEFAYLAALARREAGPGQPAAAQAIALARQAGAPALASLALLAERFGDGATATACRGPAAEAVPVVR